ncbi:MAG: four-carbon acid sugar kinase family protein [Rhodobacteraceae bacterium]|nr:four-carbon acid sugar kinase family protein [Paracoccaceae bacterium]
MKLGIIADDFTGASDIALTLAEGGMPVEQYVGIPSGPAGAAAAVVSLKCRTIPAGEAVAQVLAACDWLVAQGAEQIIYKVCSTFDSTAEGNIGPVTEALAAKLGAKHVLVCPAFPENGRSVYQGHLFVGDKPLNESGMQDHPLTPMTDSDLRRVLAAQSVGDVHHIGAQTVWRGSEAVREAITRLPAGQIIIDAIRDDDLRTIGQAAGALMTGGSGIALGLPAVYGYAPGDTAWESLGGRGAILSGSCSRATREQVSRFSGPKREITAEEVLGGLTSDDIAAWILDQDTAALVYSSADPAIVAAAQEAHGRERVATAIEGAFAKAAVAMVDAGLSRLVVAGGETSGAVVEALKPSGFAIGPRLAAGVPSLKCLDQPLALALKSGNFGGPDFFEEALEVL